MASGLPLIPDFFERFIERWADKRQPLPSHEVTVNRHRLYILPTRHGITYFIILLLILFGSINYENSLGFMLTFLLGALGLLGMVYTHQNINKLKVKIGRAQPVFAGQHAIFPLYLSKEQASTVVNLKFLSETGQISTTHIIEAKNAECQLIYTTHHRGYVSPHRIKLFTEFPLGLFHAWSWLKLESRCLVYPAPDTVHHILIPENKNKTGQFENNKKGVDDFSGIRQYQTGDQLNHMAWKAIAKTGDLQTKLFNSESSKTIWINWNQTSDKLETEKRLSILCRMVLDASEKSIVYGLQIPGTKIVPADGLQHKHQCLKSLALFGKPLE